MLEEKCMFCNGLLLFRVIRQFFFFPPSQAIGFTPSWVEKSKLETVLFEKMHSASSPNFDSYLFEAC